MNKPRYSTDELLHSTQNPPEGLDYLEFEYQGITFRCYGILHGITGGLNREYCEFVKKSIRTTEGIKLAEKGMKQLYPNCGIDEEMEDWLVLRKIDCLVMGFQLLADPRCLWMITVDAIRERLRKHDPFISNNRQNITDLGESPYFHYLDEDQRRELIGFLPSQQAITKDLNSMTHWYGAILPKPRQCRIDHPQWHRILLLERIMHIPCRSIHMLHYALGYAKQHKHRLVNIFVGETHNTDMYYLANNLPSLSSTLNNRQKQMLKKIMKRAIKFGNRSSLKVSLQLISKKIGYLLFLLIGAILALSIYIITFMWISSI